MSQKIRIKLKSYDHNLVDKSAEKIVKTVKVTGAIVSGPIPKDCEDSEIDGCDCERSHSSPHAQAYFYGKPFDFREQEITRTVPVGFL